MKKISVGIMFLLIFPVIVHAETITYDVCESGCEYENYWSVQSDINSLGDLSDKDIIININSDYTDYFNIGNESNMIKSLTINGNNHSIRSLDIYANNIIINGLIISEYSSFYSFEKLAVKNSNISQFGTFFTIGNQLNSNVISYNEVLEMDDESLDNVKMFGLAGNIKMENMDFKNKLVESMGGTQNFYNCQFGKLINVPQLSIYENIYNSTFDSLKYINIKNEETEALDELNEYFSTFGEQILNYDIYDINATNMGLNGKSITTVYFDKELELKLNDKIDLTEYLDYYTNDKEINYIIEDESSAKIENKELIGLKEGQTNITVTTDDGHVVYKIKLNVIKETIVEQIENKTIEIPPAGIKIKLWVLVSVILLFGIIGVCIYILIRSKKAKLK